VVPLAISSGAGSGAQNAIGTGVLGGVVAGTLLNILFVPLFFVAIRSRLDRRAVIPSSGARSVADAPASAAPQHFTVQ
jgi:hypothetical protein